MIHPINTNISPITALPGLLSEDRPDAVNNLVEVELPLLSEQLEVWTDEVNQVAQDIQDIGENAINAITFDNIAQLKLNSNMGRVDILGYYTKGDGGGGLFYWDSTSTESDNGGTIIQATGITTGRWKRAISSVVNVREFGVKGDGVTNNTVSYSNIALFTALNQGISLCFDKGEYYSTSPFIITGYGTTVTSNGKVVLISGNSNETFNVTAYGPNIINYELSSTLTKGSSSTTVSDSTGISVGDMVMIYSDRSINSSGSNNIPLYKQWFTIREISGNTLYFSESADFDFVYTGTSNTTAKVLYAGANSTLAVNIKVSGLTFRNSSSYTSSYMHRVFNAYNISIHNCNLDAYSALGFTGMCDKVEYKNVKAVGYNGFSSARGTNQITIDNCSVAQRYISPQNYSIFSEETTDKILITNSKLEGIVSCGSSSDITPEKTVLILNSKISVESNYAVRFGGIYGNLTINNCELIAKGAVGGSTYKTIIDCTFINRVTVTNTRFTGSDSDSYAIAAGNIGNVTKRFWGNDYGTSLGIHSSLSNSINVDYTELLPNNKTLSNTDTSIQVILDSLYGGKHRPLVFRTQTIDTNGYIGSIGFNGYVSDYASNTLDTRIDNTYGAWGIASTLKTTSGTDLFSISYTSPSGSKSKVLEFVGNSNGTVYNTVRPGADNTQALGSSDRRWSVIYTGTGTINTSDDREKTYLDIADIEKQVAIELKANMKKFKFNNSIEEKGEDKARIHFGASAQTVKFIFEKHGLNAFDYAIFCYDEWEDSYETVVLEESILDEDGSELTPAKTKEVLIRQKGNKYGLRYEELLSFIIGCI